MAVGMQGTRSYTRYLTTALVVAALIAALVLVAISVREPERYLELLTSTTV